MAVFRGLDWRRPDVGALVHHSGLCTVREEEREAARAWFESEGYQVVTSDLRPGLTEAVPALGRLLDWQGQFGYTLGPENRNLDALRDGFALEVSDEGGFVLELLGVEQAWREDPRWLLGLLAIARGYSREQTALGRRFLVLLPSHPSSPLIGAEIETARVPGPAWGLL